MSSVDSPPLQAGLPAAVALVLRLVAPHRGVVAGANAKGLWRSGVLAGSSNGTAFHAGPFQCRHHRLVDQ
jgi:hypothetical protein